VIFIEIKKSIPLFLYSAYDFVQAVFSFTANSQQLLVIKDEIRDFVSTELAFRDFVSTELASGEPSNNAGNKDPM